MKNISIYSKIVKEIGVHLSQDKFLRNKGLFFKSENIFVNLIEVQRNRFGDRFNTDITINLQVYWDEIRIARADESTKFPEYSPGCGECANLGKLRPATMNQYGNKVYHSWDISETTDFLSLSIEIVRNIREYAYPWFEKVGSKEYMIGYLDKFYTTLKDMNEYEQTADRFLSLKKKLESRTRI